MCFLMVCFLQAIPMHTGTCTVGGFISQIHTHVTCRCTCTCIILCTCVYMHCMHVHCIHETQSSGQGFAKQLRLNTATCTCTCSFTEKKMSHFRQDSNNTAYHGDAPPSELCRQPSEAGRIFKAYASTSFLHRQGNTILVVHT